MTDLNYGLTKPTPAEMGLTRAAYTVREACAALSIPRTRLYELIKDGRLHPRRLGGRTLLLAPDLATFLASLPPTKKLG